MRTQHHRIRKYDIRTWMARNKIKPKESTATNHATKNRIAMQVIDMTCNAEETSCPDKPIKPTEAEDQNANSGLQEGKFKKKREHKAKAEKNQMHSLFFYFPKKSIRASTENSQPGNVSSTAKYVQPSLVEDAVTGSQTMSVENLLAKVKETAHKTRLSQPAQRRRFKHQRADGDVEIVKTQTVRKRIKHNKFFQFEEDRRPPFFGVETLPAFTSSRVSGRRPFEQDSIVFDYDQQSDDKSAIGESLSDSEHEPEDAEPKENEYRYDGWLCGDKRIQWIQEDDEEESGFGRQDETDGDGMMDEEQSEIEGKIFKSEQKANTAFCKTNISFRLVTSVPKPGSNLRNYKAQALVPLPYAIGKPFEAVSGESECFVLSVYSRCW